MKKVFKKYFVPHEHNGFRPHFLREGNVIVLTSVILLLVVFSRFQSSVLVRTEWFGAILPGVLVDLANYDRVANSEQPLKANTVLQEAARLKAEDMAKKSYFAHTSPEGLSPWHWFKQVGYSFTHAGENLAINFSESADVEAAWMNSPGHRANILNGNFTEIGISMAEGVYQGRPTIFVVQMFGSPAFAAVPQPLAVQPPPPAPLPLPAPVPQPAPAPTPTPPPIVKGEDSLPAPVPPPALEVIAENDMFISVKNTGLQPAEGGLSPRSSEAATRVSPIRWLVETLLASPKKIVGALYLFIALQVLLALVLMIWHEVHRHHPRHVVYGVFLLALLLGAFYYISVTGVTVVVT